MTSRTRSSSPHTALTLNRRREADRLRAPRSVRSDVLVPSHRDFTAPPRPSTTCRPISPSVSRYHLASAAQMRRSGSFNPETILLKEGPAARQHLPAADRSGRDALYRLDFPQHADERRAARREMTGLHGPAGDGDLPRRQLRPRRSTFPADLYHRFVERHGAVRRHHPRLFKGREFPAPKPGCAAASCRPAR